MGVIMAVVVEMLNTGNSEAQAEIVALIEHALCEQSGDWRVSIVGSRQNDNWDLRIEGQKGFERSYTLVGGAGEHQPEVIRRLLPKLLPLRA